MACLGSLGGASSASSADLPEAFLKWAKDSEKRKHPGATRTGDNVVLTCEHGWYAETIKLCINPATGARQWCKPKTGEVVYSHDGTAGKEVNRDDLHTAFCFLSVAGGPADVLRAILNTPLPPGTEIHRFDTGMVCTGVVEVLETATPVETSVPVTKYWQVFDAIGDSDERSLIAPGINGHPDSVYVKLEVRDGNKIFFGYER